MKKATHSPADTPRTAVVARMKLDPTREGSETVPDYFTLFLIKEFLSSIGLRHKH